MSKFIVFAGLICVLLQTSLIEARTTRDAGVTTTIAPITFNDIVKQTDDALKGLQANFLNFWGVKSTDELSTLVQTQTKTYSDKLQASVDALVEEAKTGKANELLKGFTDKLTTQIDEWKTKNPELITEAQKYQESFQTNLKGIFDETKEFNEKLRAEGAGMSGNLEKLVKQIYDNTLETAKTVSSQVEAAVKKD